jgi:hypothetical protein
MPSEVIVQNKNLLGNKQYPYNITQISLHIEISRQVLLNRPYKSVLIIKKKLEGMV